MFSDFFVSPGISVNGGGAVIESTESGVFCHAMIIDASTTTASGVPLHLVRVNPHPGTIE